MRLAAAVPLGLFALTACVPPPNVPPGPRYPDLRIDVALVKDGNKCFVRFVDPKDKAKERAVAWTANAVIWSVVDNSCGELTKGQAKALGLRFIKARIGGKPPFWDRDRCSFLLTPDQEQAVCRLLRDMTPDQLTLPVALWTRQAVSDLLAHRYGVRPPIGTMGAYLQRWGFTPQKPRTRAYEQSPAAVQRWLADTYPTIAREAKTAGAEIFWGDQTGLTNQPNAPRGYAPRGQTPVVRQRAARFSLSMMSAVTNRGSVWFMCYPGALNAARCCTFLRRLVKTTGGPLAVRCG